jgi:hypothetical protein
MERLADIIDITARSPQAPTAEAPAMSDASGNVVSFDSASVYLGMQS